MYIYSAFIVPWTTKYTEVLNLTLDYILMVYVLLGLVILMFLYFMSY